MRMGRIAVVTAAACMLSISAFAQSNKTSNTKAYKQSMTLTGCLMGEKEYKGAHEGKANSSSAKADDEFVLTEGSCGNTASGKAYRLVGKRSHELKPFVGQRIEITGSFEEKNDAKVAAGEKKSSLPPEVVVASFRAVTAASAAPAPAPVAESAAPAPEPQVASAAPAPVESPAPVATEARNELPKTASNLPLVGLIGLLSLTAAFGLRLARPRAS